MTYDEERTAVFDEAHLCTTAPPSATTALTAEGVRRTAEAAEEQECEDDEENDRQDDGDCTSRSRARLTTMAHTQTDTPPPAYRLQDR